MDWLWLLAPTEHFYSFSNGKMQKARFYSLEASLSFCSDGLLLDWQLRLLAVFCCSGKEFQILIAQCFIFSGFLPSAVIFCRNLPVIGSFLSLPGIKQVCFWALSLQMNIFFLVYESSGTRARMSHLSTSKFSSWSVGVYLSVSTRVLINYWSLVVVPLAGSQSPEINQIIFCTSRSF